jgi:transcriptional regulator with XRE-family HTH domain
MTAVADFSTKLELALKALSMSRGRLAADLGVDKSLVGRWASGAVSPSDHNLANLTRLIASKKPGFTMLDWDKDVSGLAAVFGVDAPAARNGHPPTVQQPDGLPLPILEQARLTTARRGATYEGFWRTTRPSVMMPGQFFHDFGMIRKGSDGLLNIKVGGAGGLMFDGWLFPAEGQLFAIMFDSLGLTPIFLAMNGVPLPRASRLDGLVMAAALNAARTPSAYPIIFDRIGDLTGDTAQDDAECEALLGRDPRGTEESVPQEVRDHLIRDIGPAAAAKGGDLFLLSSMANTFSRGATLGGQLTG